MAFHTKRSPSKAKQFLTCPGTFAICSTVPPELRRMSSDAARLGTATHSVVEHALKTDRMTAEYLDRIIVVFERVEGDGSSMLKPGAKMPKPDADRYIYIVDQEMVDAAEVCVEYVRQRCEELGIDTKELQLETRTNPVPDRDDTSGTADVTIIARMESVLEVADFKNGYMIVDHVDNDQARAYLLGKAIEYDFEFEVYRTTICQPRAQHADGAVRYAEYTADELRAFQKSYIAGLARCEAAEAAFEDNGVVEGEISTDWADEWLKAGEHCTFCDAGAICPTRRKAAEELAAIEFDDDPTDLSQLPAPLGPRAVGTAEEQVSRILKWKPFLEDLFKAAVLYGHRALEAGYDIPDFKLVARRSNRKLVAGTSKQIADDIVAAGYVKDRKELFHPPTLKTGPQIEKLVPKKLRKKFNDEFLLKPDNGTTIAPIDDPRASVMADPGADFEDNADVIEGDFEEVKDGDEFNFG